MGFLDWYQRDRKLSDYAPGELKREEDRLRIRANQCLSRLEQLEEERDTIFRRGAHSPGETRTYSNLGYAVLAAIVENVTGKSYETFLRETLFLPAGLELFDCG